MNGSDVEGAMSLLRRVPVLAACRDEASTRRQIAERAGLSRTTAYRATTALVETGHLAETGRGYVATPRGRALLAASERFRDGIAAIDALKPLFDVVDDPTLIENAHRLGDVEVVVADASNPYRIVERAIERLEGTTTSVGTLVNPTAAEAIRQSADVVPAAERVERILTEPALEAHETIDDAAFAAAVADGPVDLLVAPADAVPFSFAIDDDDVSIVGHDPRTGLPAVHVESADPAAREWLSGVYERCRERATPIDA